MKTILENGARPASVPWKCQKHIRLVDWARSFSSLTMRKRQIGRGPKDLTRIGGCSRSQKPCEYAAGKTFTERRKNQAL